MFILLLATYPCATKAQSITVGYRQTIHIPLPGTLAAYSLDDFYAEATAQEETLAIFGKNPGTVHIIAVMRGGVRTFEIQILSPRPSYPPGFVQPLSVLAASENGSYEFRYTSEPSQSESIIDFMRREGDRLVRFHLDGTFVTGPVAGQSAFSLSSISYQIRTPHRDITLMDQFIVNSPLTVDGSIVRGFHLREGNFIFHAGYTSLTTFDNLILPSLKEGVFGAGYRFSLRRSESLTPNLYFFTGRPESENIGQRGAVASLVYNYEPSSNLGLVAEAGFSRGVGAAARFHYEGVENQLAANIRYESRQFASVSFNSLHGFYSDVAWTLHLTPRITSSLSFTGDHYTLRSLNLTNVVSNESFQFQLFRNWSLFSGANYGYSKSHIPSGPAISSLGWPIGIGFYSGHFQGSFRYQYSKNFTALLRSDEFRATLGTQWNGFHLSGFADRQTQALTLGFTLEGNSSLDEALDKLDISATTPEQLALLLRETAGLVNQGFIQGVNINLSPLRFQAGGDLTWSNRRQPRQQVHFSFLYDKDDLVQGTDRAEIWAASDSLKFKNANEFLASLSLLRTRTSGSPDWRTSPLIEISVRHQFESAPSFIIPRRLGAIRGVVFADNGATGTYQPGGAILARVEVVLDDKRRVRTDQSGHYVFPGVSFGSHFVEAIYNSTNPFFFTTASRVQTDADSEVNFGIGLSSASLSGFVRSDAGIGLFGVEVRISKGSQSFSSRTGAEGQFHVEGLSPGTYEAAIDIDSVPPGYSLAGLAIQRAIVEASAPCRIAFSLKAIRNISGIVTVYDRATQKQMPLPGVTVLLGRPSRASVTDDSGIYLFRDLSPGAYKMIVVYRGSTFTREIILPDTPAFPKDIQIEVGEK